MDNASHFFILIESIILYKYVGILRDYILSTVVRVMVAMTIELDAKNDLAGCNSYSIGNNNCNNNNNEIKIIIIIVTSW